MSISLKKTIGFCTIFLFCTICSYPIKQQDLLKNFGGWSIDKELFDYIRQVLPTGKTILELGSGWASGILSEYYTVYSIEHDPQWVGKYNTHYIYAPIRHGWYDVSVLSTELPTHYDLILIDGPTGTIGRWGFYTNLYLFNTNTIMIFDDVNRIAEYHLLTAVSHKLNKPYTIYESNGEKKFGVILPKKRFNQNRYKNNKNFSRERNNENN